jgi:hypothetical protein
MAVVPSPTVFDHAFLPTGSTFDPEIWFGRFRSVLSDSLHSLRSCAGSNSAISICVQKAPDGNQQRARWRGVMLLLISRNGMPVFLGTAGAFSRRIIDAALRFIFNTALLDTRGLMLARY